MQPMQGLHAVFNPGATDVLQGTVDTLLVIFGTTGSKWQMCN